MYSLIDYNIDFNVFLNRFSKVTWKITKSTSVHTMKNHESLLKTTDGRIKYFDEEKLTKH